MMPYFTVKYVFVTQLKFLFAYSDGFQTHRYEEARVRDSSGYRPVAKARAV